MRGRLGVIGVVVALALVVGWQATSGPSESSGSGDGSTAAPDQTDEPQRGGTLRLALERPEHLDPAFAGPVPVGEPLVADLLFDGLTAPGATAGEVRPALAERWRPVAAQQRWRFRLRDDARFTDGRPVRAADVVATFERVTRAGALSPVSALLRPLRAVTAVSKRVVRIELDRPMAELPAVLGAPGLGIVPRDAGDVGTEAADRSPVGSGPFSLGEGEALADDARRLRLVRAEGGNALLDGIDLVLRDDPVAAHSAFTSGRADWSLVPPGERAAVGATTVGLGASLFYGFDLTSPDLADVRFREAIVRAVDRRAIAEDVYDTGLTPGRSVVPVSAGGGGDPCDGRCSHSPRRARRLLREVFPDGAIPEVAVDVEEGGRQLEVATAIVADLRAVDIPAVLRPRPFEAYRTFAATPGGEHELFRLGWTGGYPSPAAFLEPLFATAAPDNVVGLSAPRVDLALNRARRTADPVRRAELLDRAERAAMAQLPVLPLGSYTASMVTSDRVEDLTVGPAGTLDFEAVWLAEAAR